MNKISVITGGTTGLGFELAKKLLYDGHNVCVIARHSSKKFDGLLQVFPNNLKFFQQDIVNDEEIGKIAKQICSEYEIEYLINNAGKIEVGDFQNNTLDKIKRVFESNVIGTIIITRNFLPFMKKANAGKVVIVNSSAGLLGKAQESIYCAAKFAQRGYLNALKEELKSTKIKVLGCYPGGMNTEFYDNLRDYAPKSVTDKFMKPDAVADIICENLYHCDSLNISEIIIERI